jgi:hypothetical protein
MAFWEASDHSIGVIVEVRMSPFVWFLSDLTGWAFTSSAYCAKELTVKDIAMTKAMASFDARFFIIFFQKFKRRMLEWRNGVKFHQTFAVVHSSLILLE